MYSVKFSDGTYYGPGGYAVSRLADASKWDWDYAQRVASRFPGATVGAGLL